MASPSAEEQRPTPSIQLSSSMVVLFYPVGSRKWNIRQRPHPDASIVGTARHGNRELSVATEDADGVRWLLLARGGWVRQKHPEFMQWRWPDDTQAEAYYGWHPSELVSDKIVQASEQNWHVPVDIAVGVWRSGYSFMAHPNRWWAAAQITVRVLFVLAFLLFIKHTLRRWLGS